MGRIILVLLLGMVLGASYFVVAFLVRGEPDAMVMANLPAPLRASAVQGNTLLVAAGPGGLVRVALDGTITPLLRVNGQSFGDVTLAGDKVYVLADAADGKSILHTVDALKGTTIRNQALSSSAADVAGALADGTLVIIEGTSVRFLKPDGRTLQVKVEGGVLNGSCIVDDMLYVARSYAGGLAVIDTREVPKLVDVIEAKPWLMSVAVAGRRAFVKDSEHNVGIIDLDSREYRAIKARDVLVTSSGETYAIGSDTFYQIDDRGRTRGKLALPPWVTAKHGTARLSLVAVADGFAILARGDQLVWLSRRVAAKPEATGASASAEQDGP